MRQYNIPGTQPARAPSAAVSGALAHRSTRGQGGGNAVEGVTLLRILRPLRVYLHSYTLLPYLCRTEESQKGVGI